jgi:hypothetical protein
MRERIASVCNKGAGQGGPKHGPDGLSYRHLSRLAGLQHDTVGDFMRGKSSFSLKSFEALCLVLDMRLAPAEQLPPPSGSVVYRKQNTVLNRKLKEQANAQSIDGLTYRNSHAG